MIFAMAAINTNYKNDIANIEAIEEQLKVT